MEFKPGDIVKLKSDGPAMTIVKPIYQLNLQTEEREFKGYYETTWFAGKKQEKSSFHEDTITLVEDDKK
ncbi:MAG TPA: DUF2158 domain-containing protein [Candidatus Ignatzschineria merdigallinarum]|uniref:DUF2158 domain-containing protein n=1 Tax=Candidatus Ignatzschineria merdigallinarum TaxID=2838621 RepID=A0A9D1Q460_9GAMM|nr:DUF2158 domain-containing protein [Candidatus Ignatzschineria merdigallinarum]